MLYIHICKKIYRRQRDNQAVKMLVIFTVNIAISLKRFVSNIDSCL